MISGNKKALIILHEIYGLNDFIQETCGEYHARGFDTYCPDLIDGNQFGYHETEKAYDFFRAGAGFDSHRTVEKLLEKLKTSYNKVFIMGFSVGATIAWRCCESADCDGVICCYGSRIRDYTHLTPACPALLLFAREDSFDPDTVVEALEKRPGVKLHIFPAGHGFIDPHSGCFDPRQGLIARQYINYFLEAHLYD